MKSFDGTFLEPYFPQFWPQASGFQKLAKIDHFWHFCPLKTWTQLASLAMLDETFSVIFKHRDVAKIIHTRGGALVNYIFYCTCQSTTWI